MSVLGEAEVLINGARESAYGHPADNLLRIARLWSAYLGTPILPKDVAMLMVLLKMARLVVTSVPVRDQRDSVVDMAGYVGLLERLEEVRHE